MDENERIAAVGERVMVVARRDFDPQNFSPQIETDRPCQGPDDVGDGGDCGPAARRSGDAIAKCKSAGIQVRMITGDHADGSGNRARA